MKKTLEKAKLVAKVFGEGFKVQATDAATCGMGCTLGLWQGLKYKGNLKAGIATCAITIGGMSVVNGIRSVVKNTDYIKQEVKEIKKQKLWDKGIQDMKNYKLSWEKVENER